MIICVINNFYMVCVDIISFDGGGLRGIMSCIVLERLVAEFPDLLDHFDFVAGTSNGMCCNTRDVCVLLH